MVKVPERTCRAVSRLSGGTEGFVCGFPERLSVDQHFYLWRPNLPDEGDNHLIELAVAGGAEAIITNNVTDFVRGELKFPALRIVTPTQMLNAD